MNNFRFSSPEALASLGGSASRYQHNLTALRVLKACAAEKRSATPEEQVALSYYTGWGDSQVHKIAFPAGNVEGREAAPSIAAILDEAERLSVEGSILNAHYTALPVIQAIYDSLKHYGFQPDAEKTVRILEPAVGGSGNFLGLLPEKWESHSRTYAVEIDPISAQICELLYPQARVFNQAFEDIKLPYNFFDLIISNVPFSQVGVFDPSIKEKHLKESLHDYCFVKAALLAKPNGIIAFITSRYTLDKHKISTRAWLAKRTEFLAAVRLPETAFQQNAGTQVVTDIILLRKRTAEEIAAYSPTPDPSWINTEIETCGQKKTAYYDPPSVNLNHHYKTNPQYMLGTHSIGHGMHSEATFRLKPDPNTNLSKLITKQLRAQLPANAWQYATSDEVEIDLEISRELAEPTEGLVKEAEVNAAFATAISAIYLAVKKLIQAESGNHAEDEIEALRANLNERYTEFFSVYGPLNKTTNQRKCDKSHPCLPLLLALEEKQGDAWLPAAIFTRRAVRSEGAINAKLTPYEALLLSYNKYARVNLRFIASLLNLTQEEAFAALSEHLFRTPDETIVSRSEYLSGNILEKIQDAERMLIVDASYQRNIDELKAVLPARLPAGDVPVRLGSPWIPTNVIEDFIRHLIPSYDGPVQHHTFLSSWHIFKEAYPAYHSIENISKWGTERGRALWLIECGLNLRTPNIYDRVQDKAILNQGETANAQAKLEELKTEFMNWVWQDTTRADELCNIYNEKYNVYRERVFDGSHLTLPGLSTAITPRPHQKDAVWRSLCSRSTTLGHEGGAGKTGTIVMTANEMRRLGIAHRPVVAVPNHLPEQWAAEALKFYPGMKIYCPDKEALSRKERGKLMSRIATADYDLMIIPHTALKFLPIKPETHIRFINEELADLRDYLHRINQKEDRRTYKDIQRKIKAQENKLKELNARIKHDSLDTISFEECGIDCLFIDEAHEFKNLGFTTKATRIAGMNNTNSQRAYDLFLKTKLLYERGARFIGATGTPVSNSLTEVFTNMRFHQPWRLAELGLTHFDDWAQTFCDSQQAIEMKPDGSGFRVNTRFSRVTGLPELSAIWREVLDVREIKLDRPDIYNGKPFVVEVPASPQLKEIIKSLGARSENLKNVTPDVDNMLSITNDGRRAALDIRLYNPSLPAPLHSKISYCAELVSQIHTKYEVDKACQLIFCDLGTPKVHELSTDDDTNELNDTDEEIQAELKNGSFYHALKQRLIKAGVPATQVAFIHEAKTAKAKAELFTRMNNGDIRVMIGSTQKCGTGMNAQERLIAIHHLDTPWRPADLDQRNWRAQRPGNKYAQVYIFQYVTTNSFDAFSWAVIEQKSRYIRQLMAGEITARTAENVDETVLTAAQIKAIASGNPQILEKVGIETELAKLSRLYSAWRSDQHKFNLDLRDLPTTNERLQRTIELYEAALELRDTGTDIYHLVENKKTTSYAPEQAENRLMLFAAMIAKEALQNTTARRHVGTYRGFRISITSGKLLATSREITNAVNIHLKAECNGEEFELTCDHRNTFTRTISEALNNLEQMIAGRRARIAHNNKNLADIQAHTNTIWPHTEKYKEYEQRLARINEELTKMPEEEAVAVQPDKPDALLMEIAAAPIPVVKAVEEPLRLVFDLGVLPLQSETPIPAATPPPTTITLAAVIAPKLSETAVLPIPASITTQLSLFSDRPIMTKSKLRRATASTQTTQLSLFG